MAEYYGNQPTRDYFTLISALDAKFSDQKVGGDNVDLFTLSTGFQQKERFEEQPQYRYKGAEVGDSIGSGPSQGGTFVTNNTVEVVPEDICNFCCNYPCPSDLPPFSPGTIDLSISDSGFASNTIEETGTFSSLSSQTFSSLESVSHSSLDSVTDIRTSELTSSLTWGDTSEPPPPFWSSWEQTSGGGGEGSNEASGYSDSESWNKVHEDDKCLCGFVTTDPATTRTESYNQAKNWAGAVRINYNVDIINEFKRYLLCPDPTEPDGIKTTIIQNETEVATTQAISVACCPSYSYNPIGPTQEFGTWYNPEGGIGGGPWRVFCAWKGFQVGGWEHYITQGENNPAHLIVHSELFMDEWGPAVPGGGLTEEDLDPNGNFYMEATGGVGDPELPCCLRWSEPNPFCLNDQGCRYTITTADGCCGICGPSNLWGVCNCINGELSTAPFAVGGFANASDCNAQDNCNWNAASGICMCTNHPACSERCCEGNSLTSSCPDMTVCQIPIFKEWLGSVKVKVLQPKVEAVVKIKEYDKIWIELKTAVGFHMEWRGEGDCPMDLPPSGVIHGDIPSEGLKVEVGMSQAGKDLIYPTPSPDPSPRCEKHCLGWREDPDNNTYNFIYPNPNLWSAVAGGLGIGYTFPDNVTSINWTWPLINWNNTTEEPCKDCFDAGDPAYFCEPGEGEGDYFKGALNATGNPYESTQSEPTCNLDDDCTTEHSLAWYGKFSEDSELSFSLGANCGFSDTDCPDTTGNQGNEGIGPGGGAI